MSAPALPPAKDTPAPEQVAAGSGARRILAVGAHPDDVEFGCGGILIKEASRGHAVTVVSLTRGESGSHGSAEERQREAAAAASLMGTALELLDLDGDARLEDHPRNALEIARAIRRLRPHLLLAPSPEENQHPDHAKAGRLTRVASRLARYGGLKELAALPPHDIDALFFFDITGSASGAGVAHLAKIVVDVSEAFETWRAAMECHASQMLTRNYVDLQVSRSRALGAEIGVAHAMAVWANDPIRLERLTDLPGPGRRF